MSISKEIFDKFELLAFNNIHNCNNEEDLARYLKIWWCNYYKRPSKDPLLLEYTFEELLLEFFEQSLKNDRARYNQLKEKSVEKIKAMTDEEWIKLQEKEVGPITEAYNTDIPDKICDKYGE